MSSKIHILALMLTSALVLTAAVASTASAHVFKTEPVTLTGNQTTQHVFTSNTGTGVSCESVKFHSSVADTTVSSVSVSPSYENCKFGANPVTVTVNGCTYVFTVATTTEAQDMPVHVECPAGKVIEIDVPALSCVLDIGPQSPTGGVSLTNGGSGTTRDISVNATLKNIKTTPTGGFLCSLNTSAEYTGTTTVKAENEPGATHRGIWFE